MAARSVDARSSRWLSSSVLPCTDTPAPGYWQNAASNTCLNVDNCGLDVVAYACVTAGGTCCGSNCYDNMKFDLLSNGSLTSPNQPGYCMNASGLAMDLVPCSSALPWVHTADKQVGCLLASNVATHSWRAMQLQLQSAGGCLSTSISSTFNVWARPLGNGDVAMVFINVVRGVSTNRDKLGC
jgi:hypothetical protein